MTDCHSTTRRRVFASKVCQERWIKVNTAVYEPTQQDRAENDYACPRPIPLIHIRGHWLAQAGFTIDQPVKIRVMDGCLVFTAEAQDRKTVEDGL